MNKKGMTLITLAITVIVMIIIASGVMMSLNESNIIEKAKLATDAYNLSNVQQLANMAYSNVYFSNLKQGIRREITVEELLNRMEKDGLSKEELEGYNFVIEDGEIYITIRDGK